MFEHEDPEAADHTWDNQRLIGIQPTELNHHLIFRNNGHGPWQHHSTHDHREQQGFAFEGELGEDKAKERGGIDNNGRNGHRNHQAIPEHAHEIEFFLNIGVVVEGGHAWEETPT